MKRFYLAIFLFVLPIFIFLWGAELYVRSLPNIYKYKNEWMEGHAEEVETLILGNSFALGGIIPDSIGKNTFNLAFAGEPLVYDHFLFFKWTNRYKNLKTVIHSISYFTFYEGSYRLVRDDVQETTYKLYMDCPYHSDFSSYSLESRHFRVFSEKIKRHFSGSYDWTQAYRGWQLSPDFSADKAPTFDRENKKYARLWTVPSYEQAEVNMELIAEEAAWCVKHGVRYILVSPPHWRTFNVLQSRRQIKKNLELISALQQRYPITYLNYCEDDRFVESDFGDRMHLTVSGAQKFTKILMRDLKSVPQ